MSTIRPILAVLLAAGLLVSCDSGKDSYLEEFLSKQNTHWTEIKNDFDIPGPDRPEGYKGLNKQGYYSGALMGNGLIGTNMYKAEAPDTYRLNVGRSDVTEQREGYDLYKKGRLPIGYFILKTVGNVSAEEMDLSIYDAFLVDAVRKGGKTENVEVYSEKGNTCWVQTDILPDELVLTRKGKQVDYRLLPSPEMGENGSLVEFSTTPGSITVIARKR